ncbi:hypothetical protein NQ318_023320 [Aromia moschata]|uniref:Acyl-CoA synthetase family member 3, mitochondrial n=1 Tax=Aromia moschata TaxID=1265417 RepID=A0AAV8XV40_9CUCU|nr:hypothetical protein NQ318_023320 [Aromia moschata]
MLLNRHIRNSVFKFNRCLQTQPQVQAPAPLPCGPVFKNAQSFPDRIALRDNISNYTYANIFLSANELSKNISNLLNGRTNERVLFLCPNDANYVVTLWAIWLSGQIAVPLSPLHPKNVLLYYANDTNSKLLITTPRYADLMQRVSRNTHSQLHVLDDKLKLNCTQKFAENQSELEGGQTLEFYDSSDALILYTSGTTGSPKGVRLSHKNLQCQITTLLDAWKWSPNDVLLHTLPLHHIHGIVNALLCPMYVGAKTVMLKKFNANTTWSYLLGVGSKPEDRKISVYMAVPTIYSKLIEEYRRVFENDPKMVEYIKNTLKNKVRLMVSGSSPLPVPVFERWLEISGHRLLERYGMTETGMILSNIYESDREPGYVGVPLPGVSVRLAEETEDGGSKTVLECTNKNGTIIFNKYKDGTPKGRAVKNWMTCQLRAPGQRRRRLRRLLQQAGGDPQGIHRRRLVQDGDICEYSTDKKKFRMLGRKNFDIIKSGGYKISALEVETHLLAHPDVAECVVVGVADEKWGQKVAAVVVPRKDKEISLESLSEWAGKSMPKYSVPTVLKVVNEIPKNSMGKVNKRELLKAFF